MSFISATRQNFGTVPSQTYTAGQRITFRLPRVGLLSRLFLTFKGTNTVTDGTGAAAVSQFTAYNLIKRIRVLANTGAAIFDVSGYGAYLINRVNNRHSILTDSLFDQTVDDGVYTAPSAAGANVLKFGLEIPVAINPRDPVGLINLQNNTTDVTVEIDFNSEYGTADNGSVAFLTTGTATAVISAASMGLAFEYFTIPRNKEDLPALNVAHQYLEESMSFASTGEQVVSLQRGNTYVQLLHYLICANALSDAIDSLTIKYNQSETPYYVPAQVQKMLQRQRYGSDLPKGTFIHDWYMSNGLPNLGNTRDFINSANVTEFQSIVNVTGGTTVTAGQTSLKTIKRQLIQLA